MTQLRTTRDSTFSASPARGQAASSRRLRPELDVDVDPTSAEHLERLRDVAFEEDDFDRESPEEESFALAAPESLGELFDPVDVVDPGADEVEARLSSADEDFPAGLVASSLAGGLAGERPALGPRSSRELEPGADAFDHYLASVKTTRRLVREDEIRIGEALGRTALALWRAALSSPAGAAELEALASDVREGRAPLWELVDLVTEETLSDASGLALLEQAASGVPEASGGGTELRLRPAALRRVEAALSSQAGEAAALASLRAARFAFERTKAELVEAYLPLVISVAKKHRARGLALGDLVQEGNVGLIRAAEKFDHRRGVRFGTYATWWIRQAIARAVINQGPSIRVPVRLFQSRGKVLRVRQTMLQERGSLPSPEEIAERTGLRRAEVDAALDILPEPQSLETPIGEDARLGDFVASADLAPDEAAEGRAFRAHVPKLLETLEPRERFVLRMRFGIDEARDYTLEEIGKALSLSRERVRQIEAAALKKLRRASAAHFLAG